MKQKRNNVNRNYTKRINSTRPLKLQQGDISINCNKMNECRELAGVARDLRKSTPQHIKLGNCSVKVGTIPQAFALIGGSLVLLGAYRYICNKWIKVNKNKNNEEAPQKDISELLKNNEKQPEVVTLNQIGKQDVDELVPLLGDYYYAGDIVLLFSITNKGKTLTGIQNAIELAQGVKTKIIPTETTPPKQDVIYYNFEMRMAQIKKRYFSNDPNATYPENLRIINSGYSIKNVDDLLNDTAARAETLTNDTVIFYDTIKDVCPAFFSNEASRVINSLRNIIENVRRKKGIRLTFVLIGQTVKKNIWKSIELEDLSGTFNQQGLADSVFALGPTRFGKNVRMLKMLKGRNDGLHDEVDLVRIMDKPYLHIEYLKSVDETDALPFEPKGKKNGSKIILPDKSPLETEEEELPKVPHEVVKQMKAMWKKGVPGRSLASVLEKYGVPYGLNHAMQVKRLIEAYDKQKAESLHAITPL